MWRHLVHNPAFQIAILLLLPLTIWIVLFLSRRYSILEYSASILVAVFQIQSSLIFNIVLLQKNIWHFTLNHALFYGVPIDLVIGQSLVIAVLFLFFEKIHLYLTLLSAILFIFFLYGFTSLVTPLSFWWVGIALLTALSILPSLLLAKWTVQDQHVYLRATLQSLAWACLLLWFLPSIIFLNTASSWQPLLSRSITNNILYLLPMLIPAGILLSALKQFAVEGQGTAFPFDPPKVLVIKGIYAYISNPMQVGICFMMIWWGVVLNSFLVGLCGLIALLLFIVYEGICNGSSSIGERDPNWILYHREVPKWIPRKTPWKLNGNI